MVVSVNLAHAVNRSSSRIIEVVVVRVKVAVKVVEGEMAVARTGVVATTTILIARGHTNRNGN